MGWGPFSYSDWRSIEEDEREECTERRREQKERSQKVQTLKHFKGNARKVMDKLIESRKVLAHCEPGQTINFGRYELKRFLTLIEKVLKRRKE